MQSDGNSFCGDVVLDSFNKTSLDEDNFFFYHIFNSKDVRISNMMILIPYNITRKLTLHTVALKANFMSSLLLCAVFL